jgi:hypothetical protein
MSKDRPFHVIHGLDHSAHDTLTEHIVLPAWDMPEIQAGFGREPRLLDAREGRARFIVGKIGNNRAETCCGHSPNIFGAQSARNSKIRRYLSDLAHDISMTRLRMNGGWWNDEKPELVKWRLTE